jgi:hypothetical protein
MGSNNIVNLQNLDNDTNMFGTEPIIRDDLDIEDCGGCDTEIEIRMVKCVNTMLTNELVFCKNVHIIYYVEAKF